MPACFFALAKFMFIHYNASLFRFQRLLLYGIVVTMKENTLDVDFDVMLICTRTTCDIDLRNLTAMSSGDIMFTRLNASI